MNSETPKPARKQSHDLFKLTPGQKRVLKKRIKEWNGLVRIFVHPLFEKWHWPADQYVSHHCNRRLIKIEEVLSRILVMPEKKTPPVIIMEEGHFVKNLQAWLAQNPNGASQRNTYCIATWSGNPTPDGFNSKHEAWDFLITLFRQLGVKKILMGGMQFSVATYKTDWTGKPPYCDRCIGIALSYLSRDKAGPFDVELSALIDSIDAREVYVQVVNESRHAAATISACT